MKTKEARKFLKDQFEKNPKPSIKELASLVSWEQKKVYRYFVNKRANKKRNEKMKLEKEVPTSSVDNFYKYWEKEITRENASERTNDEWRCDDACCKKPDIMLSQMEWDELEELFEKLSSLTDLDENTMSGGLDQTEHYT